MHELSIVEALIETIVPKAKQQGANRILEVNFHIGEMSGIVPSCIEEYFALASKGTIAEGARITMHPVPAKIRCEDCGFEGAPDKKNYNCPACGAYHIRLTAGREYFIENLVVD